MSEPLERIAVYVKQSKRRKLIAKLALKGLNLSDWVRMKVDEELEKK